MNIPRQRWQIIALTDVGCVRSNNEDSVGFDQDLGIAVLADGMGGHRAGEVASAMAVGTILHELTATLRQDMPETQESDAEYASASLAARAAIIKANQAIYQTAQRQPNYEGMGTTVVVALFYGNRSSICHVGDSRLYRLRDGVMEQLTTDHSLLAELIAKGYFKTPEEAAGAGLDNAITRAMGLDEQVEVDILEEFVREEDIYLLCSDGLTDMVCDRDIQNIIEQHAANLEQAAAALIADAKAQGGKDNISVILVRPIQPGVFDRVRTWCKNMIDGLANRVYKGN